MGLITDKQTIADLNLTGKYKVGSMFNLFNRVKTRGGELLLENMFREPLTDAALINQRANQIAFLTANKIKFEINSEMTDQAAQYIIQPKPSGRISSIISCYRDKAFEILYRSGKFAIQQRQLHAMQEVLFSAGQLLGQLQKVVTPVSPCAILMTSLESIIMAPDLKQVKAKYPYTLQQTAELKYLFLNKYREPLEQLLSLLYQFDVYIAVANVARDREMVFAEAVDHSKGLMIKADNLRHPSLANAIGNEITLDTTNNVVFLTGANMAGKSTWMKTLGVSLYLAHMGFPIASESMKFSVMEGIFTSINVPDDISLGWSHFYAEVMRVKLVAEQVSSGKKLFILFDELFKGTNVKDAYDATLAVTEKLARYDTCAFVISTHIIEVGEALKDVENVQFRYMPTVMKGTVPHYTYTLTEGITEDRQGMIIIENEGILQMLEA